jgi:opacity protein-like surface antigen
MTANISLKTLILVAAAAAGLATSAAAQAANVAPPNPTASAAKGLLGQTYGGVTFDYLSLKDGPPGVARGYSLTLNQAMNDGFDGTINYQLTRAEAFGRHVTRNRLDLDLTAFSLGATSAGKPFITAGAGWEWDRGAARSENSFLYLVGAGLEYQVAPGATVTPYVNFARATSANRNETGYGVKAAYQIDRRWSTFAKVQYNDITREPNHLRYSVGVNWHF